MKRSPLAVQLFVAVLVAVAACSGTGSGAEPSPTGGSAEPTVAGATGEPSSVPSVPPWFNAGTILREFPVGSPRNSVRLHNREDGRFMARGHTVMHRVPGQVVDPMNVAIAEATCTDCQTIAVAIQVVFYERGANDVRPQNIAIALNSGCTRCITVARAIQFVIPLDDLDQIPDDARELVRDVDREMKYFAQVRTVAELDTAEAEARLSSLIAKYERLAQFLVDIRDEDVDGEGDDDATATPSATASPAPSETPTPTPIPTPTPTDSPTPSPTSPP